MATGKKARVRNAADPEQVNRAREGETFSRDDALNDLRGVLGTYAGRRFLWRLLGETRAFESVFSSDPSRTAYYAGRQDFGHFLMSEIGEASPEMWIRMQQEANKMDANTIEPDPHTPEPLDG